MNVPGKHNFGVEEKIIDLYHLMPGAEVSPHQCGLPVFQGTHDVCIQTRMPRIIKVSFKQADIRPVNDLWSALSQQLCRTGTGGPIRMCKYDVKQW